MKEFISDMKYQINSECFHQREAANLALLGYDLGRAKTKEEEDNARRQYNFRSWIVSGSTVEEASKLERKYR